VAHDRHAPDLSPDHDALLARGRRLQLATIAWNLMEIGVTIGLGIAAGSLALVAFGLDSIVEVFASVVTIWYIAQHHDRHRVVRSLRLVAVAFGVLAVYLFVASGWALANRQVADSSPWGIAYLAVTAGVMFGLARTKRVTASRAHSGPLAAEASMTLLDGWLATGILAALVLHAVAGLWWADPVAGAAVGVAAIGEAVESLRAANEV
jgi:divalent metal cation (Fe/Co/Zn/Cd) transporter